MISTSQKVQANTDAEALLFENQESFGSKVWIPNREFTSLPICFLRKQPLICFFGTGLVFEVKTTDRNTTSLKKNVKLPSSSSKMFYVKCIDLLNFQR